MSRRSLCRAAGKSEGLVEQILAGRTSPENIERETGLGLARAGNVRFSWFMTGMGPREPFDESEAAVPATESRLEFPSLAQFKVIARAEGADPALLEALDYARCSDGKDPGFDFWRSEYARLRCEQMNFRKDLSAEPSFALEMDTRMEDKKKADRAKRDAESASSAPIVAPGTTKTPAPSKSKR